MLLRAIVIAFQAMGVRIVTHIRLIGRNTGLICFIVDPNTDK